MKFLDHQRLFYIKILNTIRNTNLGLFFLEAPWRLLGGITSWEGNTFTSTFLYGDSCIKAEEETNKRVDEISNQSECISP